MKDKDLTTDTDVKVLASEIDGHMYTTINCSPAELVGIIRHLAENFATAADIELNEFFEDMKTIKETI